jgi:hypothetical protein
VATGSRQCWEKTGKKLNYTPLGYRTQASVLEWEVPIAPKHPRARAIADTGTTFEGKGWK